MTLADLVLAQKPPNCDLFDGGKGQSQTRRYLVGPSDGFSFAPHCYHAPNISELDQEMPMRIDAPWRLQIVNFASPVIYG